MKVIVLIGGAAAADFTLAGVPVRVTVYEHEVRVMTRGLNKVFPLDEYDAFEGGIEAFARAKINEAFDGERNG